MPLPSNLLVEGFKSSEPELFHVTTDCSVFLDASSAFTFGRCQLLVAEVLNETACEVCTNRLMDVAAAYQELSSEEYWQKAEAEKLVLLSIKRAILPLPSILDSFLVKFPAYQGLKDKPMGTSFQLVPSWLAHWVFAAYTFRGDLNHRTDLRFKLTYLSVPDLVDKHAEYFSLMEQANCYAGFQRNRNGVEYAEAQLGAGLDICLIAAQLQVEALTSDGPKEDFPYFLSAARLLTR